MSAEEGVIFHVGDKVAFLGDGCGIYQDILRTGQVYVISEAIIDKSALSCGVCRIANPTRTYYRIRLEGIDRWSKNNLGICASLFKIVKSKHPIKRKYQSRKIDNRIEWRKIIPK